MLNPQRFLFDSDRPLWRYCLFSAPLALFPSIALTAGVCFLLNLFGVNVEAFLPHGLEPTLSGLFGTVVFAPVVETLFLSWTLSVFMSLGKGRTFAAVSAAVLWGLIHALGGLLWFFGTVWSFFVFSAAYLTWRPTSFKHAFFASAITHAAVNLIAMIWVISASNSLPLKTL